MLFQVINLIILILYRTGYQGEFLGVGGTWNLNEDKNPDAEIVASGVLVGFFIYTSVVLITYCFGSSHHKRTLVVSSLFKLFCQLFSYSFGRVRASFSKYSLRVYSFGGNIVLVGNHNELRWNLHVHRCWWNCASLLARVPSRTQIRHDRSAETGKIISNVFLY